MSRPGSPDTPLRVAVVGSGPAGFYTVQHLLRAAELEVRVDMFERLPTPFGLVRFGVAPDHQKIKSVTAVYEKLAGDPAFRFFGNVEIGRDLTLEDLSRHYHQIVYCTGAQSDRRMGLPGEDLRRSHPATEFVAWYNGHPDFADLEFDLTQERVVVVGVGNVAIDVARILCRSTEELARTDIADHALEALRHSRVREVHVLGRRGPAQAAFTNPELKELGELSGADARALPREVELDPLSRAAVEAAGDKKTLRKLELLEALACRGPGAKPRQLYLRFLVSPVELAADSEGGVRAVRLVRNELYDTDDGYLRPRATDEFETLEAGLVFRSVGYRGVPLPGLPFDESWGVVPNVHGRVVAGGDRPLPGVYVGGWIKRGPSGVIGTNKPDALETVTAMLEDLQLNRCLEPELPQEQSIVQRLRERGVTVVSYADWVRIDAREIRAGEAEGRPRKKITRLEEMLRVLQD